MQKGESTGCAKFVSRCSSERLMKKERNCTNFDNRMPMFGSPALPTHKVAERVEVVLRIPSFSLLASWGEVFRHFAGPSDNLFLNSAFPRSSWLPPFAVGLERRRGFNGASVIFSQTLHGPRGLRSDLASLLGEARTSGSFLF